MSEEILDGYQTLISFADDATVVFYEVEVTPPGIDGGDAIDTTRMGNSTWRTATPKSLVSLTNAAITVTYDPAAYTEIIGLVNSNNLITVTFPDTSTVAFYGYLKSFTPGSNVEGERPTAEIEVVPTLTHDTTGAETAPVITAAA